MSNRLFSWVQSVLFSVNLIFFSVSSGLSAPFEASVSGRLQVLGSSGGGGGPGTGVVLTPRFEVQNAANQMRTETVLASIPFPPGMVQDINSFGVAGRATAWMPMQRWPDGSIRIAQAQFTDEFGPGETKTYDVIRGGSALTNPFSPHPWLASTVNQVVLRPRVRDNSSNPYEAQTGLGGGSVLHESSLVRVSRKRLYHEKTGAGINRDFLTSTFYIYEFRDMPYAIVDWIVGNDYLGRDNPAGSADKNLYPLGAVAVNEASLLVKGAVEVRPYRPEWHGISSLVQEGEWVRYQTMANTSIVDCQTRRYRFYLRFEDSSASPADKQRWTASYAARVSATLYPMCDLPTWQKSGGLGLHGGPVDGPTDAVSRANDDYDRWLTGTYHFGTWGSFGDVNQTNTSGTPRNTPVSWNVAHALQAKSRKLLELHENMAWVQAIRPYHLFGLNVGDEEDIYLWYSFVMGPNSSDISNESLGRRTLYRSDPYPQLRPQSNQSPELFNGYDAEHWTTDILFDYWTLSGDHWAKEELRQLGQSLKGMMRLRDYPSSNLRATRAEGWTMAGFVQSFLATGDSSLKNYALRRIREIVDVQRGKNHPGRHITEQDPDARAGIGPDTTYFTCYENGAIMVGYLAAHWFFQSTEALRIAEDVVRSIDYSWVSNYTHPRTGVFWRDAIRYATPLKHNGVDVPANFRDSDPNYGANLNSLENDGSLAEFHVAGLALMPLHSTDPAILERAAWQLQKIYPTPTNDRRWRKWHLIVPTMYPHNQR